MASNTTLETIRKSQIIEDTLKKISEIGIHNITMDDISKESGFSKGGIAHYYSSKDALVRATFREFFDRIFIRSKETMDKHSDPLEKILSFDWLYDWSDPDVSRGYTLLYDFMSLASHDEEYRLLFHEWVENWVRLLCDALEAGVNSGKFTISDIESTARIISSIYQGIATRWYIDRNSHSSEWAINSFKKAITPLLSND